MGCSCSPPGASPSAPTSTTTPPPPGRGRRGRSARGRPVRDLAFVAFLVALLGLGFRRPFLFVLAYIYVDTVAPQRLSYYLLNSLPLSMIVACLAFAGWLLAEKKTDLRFSARQGLMALLLCYAFYTTQNADL